MLVLSRIFFGMILGLVLVLVSEICLADQNDKQFSIDKLTISHKNATLYKINPRVAVVGMYRHYEDTEIDADRVFVGLRAKF